MPLQEFGETLDALPIGKRTELPSHLYDFLFSPEKRDAIGQVLAQRFAFVHNCRIENLCEGGVLAFLKLPLPSGVSVRSRPLPKMDRPQ